MRYMILSYKLWHPDGISIKYTSKCDWSVRGRQKVNWTAASSHTTPLPPPLALFCLWPPDSAFFMYTHVDQPMLHVQDNLVMM